MVIYLDLVMGLNFLVDLLLILGTNRLCGFPSGLIRTSAAAALGGVYAAGAFVSGFAFLGSTFWRLVFLVLMGIIAFGLNRSAWRRTGIFLLLSLAMGGVALGISREGIPALLLSAASVWLLSRIGFGGTVGGKEYIPITITEAGKSISVIALKDTGNSLRDPVTGEQVLVLGPEAADRLLNLSSQALQRPLEAMMLNSGRGFRLIPYSAVGQPGGMLLAKRFSDVKMGDRRGSALVAFAPERIGVGQVYQALAGGNI
jgi:stage II sporulation protein GA (sporulation sigma-E factor processing peptidase)